jgi:G:T-mismatch repair DNA endonuclease (very short patch repair protein)
MTNKRDKWVALVTQIHQDKYQYHQVEYAGVHTKVSIVCPTHGVFWQTPQAHKKHGCPKCGNESRKLTWVENYGVDHPWKNTKQRQKIAETNIERYGAANPFASPTIQQKIKASHLNTLGVDNPGKSSEVVARRSHTMMERYGVEHFTQSEVARDRIKTTNLLNHSGVHNTQQHIDVDSLELLNTPEWLIEQHHNQQKTLNEISNMVGVDPTTVGNRFRDFGLEVLYFQHSVGERELGNALEQHGITIVRNDRTTIPPYELDIVIPDIQLAIEYNGEYWHTQPKAMQRDINKSVMCENINILLITVWEQHWLDSQQTVLHNILKIIRDRATINTI